MNPRRCKIAEQEWRESWEPVLPLIAPGERMDTPVDHAWTEAARRLDYVIRLVGWIVNLRADGIVTCDDRPIG